MSRKSYSDAPPGFEATVRIDLPDGVRTVEKLWNTFRKKHVPPGWGVWKYNTQVVFHTTDREAAGRMTPDDWQGIEAMLVLITQRS